MRYRNLLMALIMCTLVDCATTSSMKETAIVPLPPPMEYGPENWAPPRPKTLKESKSQYDL